VSGVSGRRVPVDKRTLVWRSYDAFNRRDPDAAVPLYVPTCRWIMDHFGGSPDDQEYRGHAGLHRLFADFLSVWGEFEILPTGLWDLGGGAWFIEAHMSATGMSSGVPLEVDFWQVATTVDRRIEIVDQYSDRDDALAAAGLTTADL
jgi:ketosteroid isomerase-like protein